MAAGQTILVESWSSLGQVLVKSRTSVGQPEISKLSPLTDGEAAMITSTHKNTTAKAFLPDMMITGLEEEQPERNWSPNNDLLASFVEGQHRVMGYGPVSNVFSRFLNAEMAKAS
jgi:hypothetical protein